MALRELPKISEDKNPLVCAIVPRGLAEWHSMACELIAFVEVYSVQRTEIAAIFRFAVAMPVADPRNSICQRVRGQDKAMHHCDLRVRWKIASDLRSSAAISEPKTHSFCRTFGDLALSMRKLLTIAIVRFWWANNSSDCRGRHGGVGKERRRGTSRRTPLPNRVFGPPLRLVRFHPLNVDDALRADQNPKDPAVLKILRRSNLLSP